MVRNIVVLGGNSHPDLVENVCRFLGIPSCNRILTKFSGGETRCEIQDSVRGKDVYIIQTAGGKVNDHFMDLCIMISACKIGSARRITAVLPLFPYSRQPDVPYNMTGAPLVKPPSSASSVKDYTFESVPATPGPGLPKTPGLANGFEGINKMLDKTSISGANGTSGQGSSNGDGYFRVNGHVRQQEGSVSSVTGQFTTHDYENQQVVNALTAKPGYKQWIAQAGTLVATLLTCAGADHIITMDLHDPQYQGFFDVPVDNLYGMPMLMKYIQQNIPDYQAAVIVSPDAGGAKRATSIADSLELGVAIIHKVRRLRQTSIHPPQFNPSPVPSGSAHAMYISLEQERRPTKIRDRQNATMMLVGDVMGRVCVLIDDIADTANTITRAAKLLKKEGATKVYALLTHGIFSGDAIPRINASALDKVIVTNSVPQDEHRRQCPKLEVLDISPVFSEAIRRVHHGESISVLFHYT